MVSETKLIHGFPECKFLTEGFLSPFRFDRIRNGGGIIFMYRNYPSQTAKS